jgi:hypothetical protein
MNFVSEPLHGSNWVIFFFSPQLGKNMPEMPGEARHLGPRVCGPDLCVMQLLDIHFQPVLCTYYNDLKIKQGLVMSGKEKHHRLCNVAVFNLAFVQVRLGVTTASSWYFC